MIPSKRSDSISPAELAEALQRRLFSTVDEDNGMNVYAVLDGASIPELIDQLYADDQPQFECLYRGEVEPDIAETAPYIVLLEPGTRFTDWLLSECAGQHWGIFATSPTDLDDTRRHFRRLLIVKDPEGTQVYFRFYDPRVLRKFLPTAAAAGLHAFFDGVTDYFFEGEKKTILYHCSFSGKLVTEDIDLSADESAVGRQ